MLDYKSVVIKLFSELVNHIINNLEVLKEFDKDENNNKLLDEFVNAIILAKNKGSKIFVYGVGRSGFVGKAFAMRLMHLGFNVHFVGETTCPSIKNEDILILVSGSGETFSTINLLKRVNELSHRYNYKITTISITCKKESSIKKLSEICIQLNILYDEYFPMGTLFEEISLIFLDTVVYILMKKLNISEIDMKKKHCNLQ